MNSFGHRFGRLVKNKRGIEGLSQQALAALAFDDESRKTRISEFENGKISNPHQKTVDALVIALEISKEELDACHLQAGAAAELGLRRELLESLVLRFEHDNPDAPDQELSRFLKNKAAELKELKARLSALADGEARIANQIAAAQGALDEALFDEADEILRTAEEMQQEEHTLKQVRKQAEIRAARAQAALLKGDTGAAYAHYTTAIQYFEPFDPLEAAAQRRSFGTTLREHGERFGGAGLTHAIALAELNLITYSKQAHPQDWAMTQNNLANALQVMGERAGGAEGLKALERAVAAYENALQVCTRDEMPADWAMTQNNLAGTLQIMGKRAGGAEGLKALERAVAAYENALQVYTHDDMPADWAMTQNNLANALQVMGDRAGGAEGLKTLERAVAAYENALEVRTRDHMPAQWAATQMNLGNTLAILGEREESAARLQGALEALRNARLIFVDAAGDDQYAPYFDGRIEAVEALLAKRGPDETS